MRKQRLNSKHIYPSAMIAAAALLLTYITASYLENSFNLRIDATPGKYTVLSKDSRETLSSLDKDVYLYYVGEGNQDDFILTGLLKNYAGYSTKVHYGILDPKHETDALLRFSSASAIKKGSVIVSDVNVNGKAEPERYDVISYNELFASPAQSDKHMHIMTVFSAQRKITPAIDYVSSGSHTRAVFLDSEGEKSPCPALLRDINELYYSYTFEAADTKLAPDSDTLIVISPEKDLSSTGFENIKAFLGGGGKALFFIGSVIMDQETGDKIYADNLDNFALLLSQYDIRIEKKAIVGGNPSMTFRSPVNIIPYLTDDGIKSVSPKGYPPVLSFASPITLLNTSAAIVTPVLVTDSSCYLKTVDSTFGSLLRDNDDITGAFITGVISERGESKIAVYTSSSFVVSDSEYDYLGNSGLFNGTIDYLNGNPENTETADNAEISDGMASLSLSGKIMLVFLVVAVLPGAFLLGLLKAYRKAA